MQKPSANSADDDFTFVCYAHVNSQAVYEDIEWLQDQGLNVWYDEGITAGSQWREELGEAIEQCSAFLIFLSEASLGSPHCMKELNFALEAHRPIYVVYLEPVNLSPGLKLSLNDRQALQRSQPNYQNKLLQGLTATLDTRAAITKTSSSSKQSNWSPWLIAAGVMLLVVIAWQFGQQRTPTPDRAAVAADSAGRDSNLKYAIAVLPLEEVGPQAADLYLGGGIAEELMNALHTLEEISVANRTDSFRAARSGQSTREIAGLLGVQMVLQGSVRQSSDTIRVSISLVDAATGRETWGASYDRPADDIFEIQTSIATDVANALGAELGLAAPADLVKFGTDNAEAYRLGMRGLQLRVNVGNPALLEEAVNSLQQAISLDPYYFELYAPLTTVMGALYLHNQDETLLDKSEELVAQARDLGASETQVRDLEQVVALRNHDLFEYERLQHARFSEDIEQEWNPVRGFIGPRYDHALILALAGHYQDSAAYLKSLEPVTDNDLQRQSLSRMLLDLKISNGDYDRAITELGDCSGEVSVIFGVIGCQLRIFRAKLAKRDMEGAAATLALIENAPLRFYLALVLNADTAGLNEIIEGSDPDNWMQYYRILLDAQRYDEAFAYWRDRFPIGAMYFLWDTLLLRTRETPLIAGMPGYQALITHYGITSAWRKQVCEGVHELESVTGIKAACKLD